MKITFINKSDKPVFVTLGENSGKIDVTQSRTFEVDGSVRTFTAEVDEASYITYAFAKLGVIFRRHFNLSTEYEFAGHENMTVTLYTWKKKGRYMDEYERVVPQSSDGVFSQVHCRVPDAERIKKELVQANKRGKNAIKLFDVFDILGNALQGLLLLVIPFILIWIFADFDTASRVCGIAFIPMFGVIVLFNRYIDKLRKTLWSKLKSKKTEKDVFKDYNSYFDSDYIDSVFGLI